MGGHFHKHNSLIKLFQICILLFHFYCIISYHNHDKNKCDWNSQIFYFFPNNELIPLRAPPATTDVSPAFVKSLFPVNKPNPVAAAPPANTVPPTL